MSDLNNITISHHTPTIRVKGKFCAEIYIRSMGEWEFEDFYDNEEQIARRCVILEGGHDPYVVVRFALPELPNV